MHDSPDYGVFLGFDVDKGEHHAIGLSPDGARLHDAALLNSEPQLREVFDRLAAHDRILVVVDQPTSIGALPVTVARACGHDVAYLPGLAMRPGGRCARTAPAVGGRSGGRCARTAPAVPRRLRNLRELN